MDINILETDKILVVAPHQDDESIGCGGLIAKYHNQVDVLLLTDGKLGGDVETRNNELKNALNVVEINKIHSLNLPNEELYKHTNEIKKFDIKSYTFIFIPYRKDSHPDHRIVYKVFNSMLKNQNSNASLIEYEVWTPIETPTYIMDISDVINTKRKMIEEYKSQLSGKDYVGATLGLNKYRGMFIGKEYGEAYMHSIYSGIKSKIYESLPQSIKDQIKRKLL